MNGIGQEENRAVLNFQTLTLPTVRCAPTAPRRFMRNCVRGLARSCHVTEDLPIRLPNGRSLCSVELDQSRPRSKIRGAIDHTVPVKPSAGV